MIGIADSVAWSARSPRTGNHGFDSRRLVHCGSYLKMTFAFHYGALADRFWHSPGDQACLSSVGRKGHANKEAQAPSVSPSRQQVFFG